MMMTMIQMIVTMKTIIIIIQEREVQRLLQRWFKTTCIVFITIWLADDDDNTDSDIDDNDTNDNNNENEMID